MSTREGPSPSGSKVRGARAREDAVSNGQPAGTEEERRGAPEGDGTDLRKKLLEWRDGLVKLLIVGLPTLLVQQVYKLVADRFFAQPWQALWFLIPLAGAAWIAWQVLVRGRRELLLRGPLLVFFVAYVAVFSIASQSDLLDWRRDLVGPGASAPRSWLLPTRLGDWRYWVAAHGRAARPPDDLLVITTKPPPNLAAGRQQILKLVALAMASGARGIAFDFHLRPEPSPLDQVLCATITAARERGVPTIFGYRLVKGAAKRWRPMPLAPALEACLPEQDRGHVMVVRDLDHRVRLVPLRLGLGDRPPLALRVAAVLEGVPVGKLDVPDNGYLQPVPPRMEHPILEYDQMEGMDPAELQAEVRGLFLLVGEDSEAESFHVPGGQRLGVLIHADAVDALRTGTDLRQSPSWLTLGLILLMCYLVTALAATGAPAAKLVRPGLWASLILVGGSALAVWAVRLWVDVVYGLVALWLLVTLLIILRRLHRLGQENAPDLLVQAATGR